MSEQSNKNGRAYEYISLMVLYDEISKRRSVRIIQNSSLLAAKRAWDDLDDAEKVILKKSADKSAQFSFPAHNGRYEVLFPLHPNHFYRLKRVVQVLLNKNLLPKHVSSYSSDLIPL